MFANWMLASYWPPLIDDDGRQHDDYGRHAKPHAQLHLGLKLEGVLLEQRPENQAHRGGGRLQNNHNIH